jgi:pimeloyl-ACP methyl ester carboxylesterase
MTGVEKVYIKVNGADLWYITEGKGQPVILLHGMGGTNQIFNVLVNDLSKKFTVYAIDSRRHGRSSGADIYSYEIMMEDIASFIIELNIEKPILLGFSDGGIVGLLLASTYPRMLSKLIVIGANTNPHGIKSEWRFLLKVAYFFKRDPKIKLCLEAPANIGEKLKKITVPVLVLAGSNDFVKEEDTKYIARSMRNSILNILAGESHRSYVVNSPKLYNIIKPFIEAE